MVDVTVRSEDVDNLVRAIRAHADSKALRKELYAGLNRATKDVRGEMKANVNAASTPTRGGLTDRIVKSTRITAYARPGKWASAGVKVRGQGSLAAMNFRGSFRRPGRDGDWVPQSAGVRKGLLSEPFDRNRPEVQRAIEEALENIARKVTNI